MLLSRFTHTLFTLGVSARRYTAVGRPEATVSQPALACATEARPALSLDGCWRFSAARSPYPASCNKSATPQRRVQQPARLLENLGGCVSIAPDPHASEEDQGAVLPASPPRPKESRGVLSPMLSASALICTISYNRTQLHVPRHLDHPSAGIASLQRLLVLASSIVLSTAAPTRSEISATRDQSPTPQAGELG